MKTAAMAILVSVSMVWAAGAPPGPARMSKLLYDSGLQLRDFEYEWLAENMPRGEKDGGGDLIDREAVDLSHLTEVTKKFREDYGGEVKIEGFKEVVERGYNQQGEQVRSVIGIVIFYSNVKTFHTGPHSCAGYLVRGDGKILQRIWK